MSRGSGWGVNTSKRLALILAASLQRCLPSTSDKAKLFAHPHLLKMSAAMSAVCRPSTLKGASAKRTFGLQKSRPIRAAASFKVAAALTNRFSCWQDAVGSCLVIWEVQG